jgi:hypothetical protein
MKLSHNGTEFIISEQGAIIDTASDIDEAMDKLGMSAEPEIISTDEPDSDESDELWKLFS